MEKKEDERTLHSEQVQIKLMQRRRMVEPVAFMRPEWSLRNLKWKYLAPYD